MRNTKSMWRKRRKQITNIIELCSIKIVFNQGKDRKDTCPEEEDTEVED